MKDSDCVQFLQWALPRLKMRWPGFRKVRKQVCKRLDRRIRALGLSDIKRYRNYLESHPEEWQQLDGMTRITISRFYRDKWVFSRLEHEILPQLAQQALACDEGKLRIWSAGCASGEEPYTLAMVWAFGLKSRFPTIEPYILATDAEPQLLQRASEACYSFGSVKNLPEKWRNTAFIKSGETFCLQPEYRLNVEFRQHDVRQDVPNGSFRLVLCRNLVFTYFETSLQHRFLERLARAMPRGGVLLLGVHERLPEGYRGFIPRSERWGIYERSDD